MAAIHRAAREAARNEHLAHHDNLTGLPNRVLFHDRVAQAMAAAKRDDRRHSEDRRADCCAGCSQSL